MTALPARPTIPAAGNVRQSVCSGLGYAAGPANSPPPISATCAAFPGLLRSPALTAPPPPARFLRQQPQDRSHQSDTFLQVVSKFARSFASNAIGSARGVMLPVLSLNSHYSIAKLLVAMSLAFYQRNILCVHYIFLKCHATPSA